MKHSKITFRWLLLSLVGGIMLAHGTAVSAQIAQFEARLVLVSEASNIQVGTNFVARVDGLQLERTYSFDWSGSDNALALGDVDSDTVTINLANPSNHLGYLVRVSVTEYGNSEQPALVLETIVRAVLEDDLATYCPDGYCHETLAKRIPDTAIVPHCDEPHLLQADGNDTHTLCLETEPGNELRLGVPAFLASPPYGAAISWEDLSSALGGSIIYDTQYIHIGDFYSFEVVMPLPWPEKEAMVVIPLPANSSIPEQAVWRSYRPRDLPPPTGGSGAIHSALKDGNGDCPAPVQDDVWKSGLVSGNQCIRLSIMDGGIPDLDGRRDGVIRHWGTLAKRKPIVSPQPQPDPEPVPGDVVEPDPTDTDLINTRPTGGGGTIAPLMLLFGLVALMRRVRPRNKVVWLLLSLLPWTAQANTEELRQPSWFIGGSIGQAKGELSARDVDNALQEKGFDTATTLKNRERLAGRIFGGYRFNEYFSVEGGYTNLGRTRTIVEAVTVPQLSAIADELPLSASGYELGVTAYYPALERLDLYARVALWRWEARHSMENSGESLSLNGTDILGGLGMRYWLTHNWQLGLSWDRYQMNSQYSDLYAMNVVYQFDRQPPRAVKQVQEALPSPEPAPTSPTGTPPPAWIIHFEFDSAEVVGFESEINEVVSYLNASPSVSVYLIGHTDIVGTAPYNDDLAILRVQSVQQILLERGISNERIRTEGRGMNDPVVGDTTPAGTARDRRVEILIIEKQD